MHIRQWASCAAAVVFMALTGCETNPEDIEKWQAEKNTPKLVQTLDDGRQFMRLKAIDALEAIQAVDATDDLGRLLNDPDIVIVHRAIDALASFESPATEPYMLEAITFETNPARLTAAKTLGVLQSKSAVDALSKALQDKYETVAVAAAVSLGQIGDARAIPALTATSQEGSAQLRGASMTSIRQIGGETALKPLTSGMGDVSAIVRNESTAGLIEQGAAAKPYALKALKSENNYTRQSALAVLDGLKSVPDTGSDLVWYKLADLAVGENPDIQREEGSKLAEIDGALDALIEAVAHPDYAIREHAFLALETLGEPAAAATLAAASGVKPEASRWLQSRSAWAGAPAWQLDLWGAAVALNPNFTLDARQVQLLKSDEKPTEAMLRSKNFDPSREIIPLLIDQLATSGSSDARQVKAADTHRTLAVRKLRVYRERAKFPLLAAVRDNDLEIAANAARILVDIQDDPRAKEAVIAGFAARIESGEELHATPFYAAMIELNMPEADELILKVRPDAKGAVYAFQKKYPGVHVSNMSLPPGKQHPTAEPFRLKYVEDGKAREMRVVFRPDETGNWVPEPPFPDELPDS